ncbi:conserved Archaeal protein [Sulfolobus acidocaldarius DSM 639]|uniref:Conserved Archaeal protein n=1 Tax=Sulfolobus acidocaldarius (strain ATCC 33909 / DSM 639 / JCM 8929 / NBRC 15157 / NCIMB 11770) TaxID=330779 RepID=Q4J7C0_SULAC|nr:conserved Archaeal protein [Sulfolobus acidocaldarius DSM 639]
MILTSDEATYHSLPSLPLRLIPDFFPGSKYPPYGLRKIESLVNGVVVPPHRIERYLRTDKVLGIYVNDPLNQTEVSAKLSEIFGEPPYVFHAFQELSRRVSRLKDRYDFKVIVGGPGSWEFSLNTPEWVDTVLMGEAEETLPKLLREGSDNLPKVVYGERAKNFVAIRRPSSNAEVEVKRKDRKIPLEVVEAELEVQSRYHNYLNLISDDLLSYGTEDEILGLLRLASSYGNEKKVVFSQISAESSYRFQLSKIREVLRLSENNWRSPLLINRPNSCVLGEIDTGVIKELNKNFIYPMVYVPEERVGDFMDHKVLLIPLPQTEKFYDVLYKCWVHDKGVLRMRFSRVIDYVLDKNRETRGEYLKRLNVRGVHVFNLVLLLIRSYMW